jgi:hypothetical protein
MGSGIFKLNPKAQKQDGSIGYLPFDFLDFTDKPSTISKPTKQPRRLGLYPSAWSYAIIENGIRSTAMVIKTWLEGNGVNLKVIDGTNSYT